MVLDMVNIIQRKDAGAFEPLEQVLKLNPAQMTGAVQKNQIRPAVKVCQAFAEQIIRHIGKIRFLIVALDPNRLRMVNEKGFVLHGRGCLLNLLTAGQQPPRNRQTAERLNRIAPALQICFGLCVITRIDLDGKKGAVNAVLLHCLGDDSRCALPQIGTGLQNFFRPILPNNLTNRLCKRRALLNHHSAFDILFCDLQMVLRLLLLTFKPEKVRCLYSFQKDGAAVILSGIHQNLKLRKRPDKPLYHIHQERKGGVHNIIKHNCSPVRQQRSCINQILPGPFFGMVSIHCNQIEAALCLNKLFKNLMTISLHQMHGNGSACFSAEVFNLFFRIGKSIGQVRIISCP